MRRIERLHFQRLTGSLVVVDPDRIAHQAFVTSARTRDHFLGLGHGIGLQ